MTSAEILEALLEVARADGVISGDEAALLESVREELSGFERISEAVSEGALDRFLALREARKAVLGATRRVALIDGRITDDEREILVRLLELLPGLGR